MALKVKEGLASRMVEIFSGQSQTVRFLVCLLLLLVPRYALAAGAVFTAPAGQVQLMEAGPLRQGHVPLALHFALKPGWHIYWKNPGDVGFPPSVSAPPPVALSALGFPPPQTLVQEGLKSYVLTGNVVLPFTAAHVTGPTLQVKAHWLACATQCVPGQADLTLNLATTAPSGQHEAGAGRAYQTRTTLPLWVLAVLGGLILNLMPCVFPILAMKAVSFARLGGAAHGHIRREAMGYSAGVLLSMAVLGALLLGLRAAGQAVFWGFQFHEPVFVALMAWILLIVGLSFAGLFHLPVPPIIQRLPARSSFATGLLAVLVATPCTAPFMGVAMAAALTMDPLPAWGLFLALGVGMALPILLLGFVPHLAAALPRPGRWMMWVQRLLSLPLFASFLWLGWVLFRQTGFVGAGLVLFGALLLILSLPRRPILAPVCLILLPFLYLAPSSSALSVSLPGALPYAPQTLAALRAQDRPVFVDLTAAWCITCQVNERTTLASGTIRALFRAKDITLLVGDWTRRDPAITALLLHYGRAGVPLYLYYPAGGKARILPQILTPSLVRAEVSDENG